MRGKVQRARIREIIKEIVFEGGRKLVRRRKPIALFDRVAWKNSVTKKFAINLRCTNHMCSNKVSLNAKKMTQRNSKSCKWRHDGDNGSRNFQ
jgi:hypothetical protein